MRHTQSSDTENGDLAALLDTVSLERRENSQSRAEHPVSRALLTSGVSYCMTTLHPRIHSRRSILIRQSLGNRKHESLVNSDGIRIASVRDITVLVSVEVYRQQLQYDDKSSAEERGLTWRCKYRLVSDSIAVTFASEHQRVNILG